MIRHAVSILDKLAPNVLYIIHTLRNNGFEAYFAGGAVRDILLGIEPADYDVVTNARPHQIAELFRGRKVATVGKCFSVCMVDGTEVATYRSGQYCDPLDRTCRVELSDTIHDDLKCRDFSINSMALCPFTGQIIDDFNGISDLGNKIIRFTGEPAARIAEDPCRIIRACRFLAKLEGAFDPGTFEALCVHGEWLRSKVAPERIRLELLKALHYKKPSIFFQALHDIGVLKDVFPSLARCVGLDGGPHHNETVFEHSMIAGDSLSSKNILLRLAAYLHDVGKAEVHEYQDGGPTFIGHENALQTLLDELKALKFSNDEIDKMNAYIRIHMREVDAGTTPKAVRRLLSVLEQLGVSYEDFLRLRIADRKGNLAKPDFSVSEIKMKINKFRTELDAKGAKAFSIKDLAVTGHDVMRILNLSSGPAVGRILQKMLDVVLDNPELNTYEELTRLVASWGEHE